MEIKKHKYQGEIIVPPSKSTAHRLLIAGAFGDGISTIRNIDYSNDILATIDCLRALGAKVETFDNYVKVDGKNFLKEVNSELNVSESGSTLRFFIPLALLMNKEVIFKGSKRLFERPLDIYEDLAIKENFIFEKKIDSLKIKGLLKENNYLIRGDISSQFITGLILALSKLEKDSYIEIKKPFESRFYVYLTIEVLREFGADIIIKDNLIQIKGNNHFISKDITVEGDYSNAAYLDLYAYMGNGIKLIGLNPDSIHGDKIYKDYFEKIKNGFVTLDIKDCPDLAPALMSLAAYYDGVKLINTRRLKDKESKRDLAMKNELSKLNIKVEVNENDLTVYKGELKYLSELDSHNDHRILMALVPLLSKVAGSIKGEDSVKKSFPNYFKVLREVENDC